MTDRDALLREARNYIFDTGWLVKVEPPILEYAKGLLRRIDSARATPAPAAGWRPTHRHYNGGLYRLIGTVRIEATLARNALYQNEAGDYWMRPWEEFHDKLPDGRLRFEALATPTPAPSPVVEDGFPHLCRPPLDHSWVRTDDGGRRCASCKRYEGPTPPAALEEDLLRLVDAVERGNFDGWKVADALRGAARQIAAADKLLHRIQVAVEMHAPAEPLSSLLGYLVLRHDIPEGTLAVPLVDQITDVRAALTPEDRHG